MAGMNEQEVIEMLFDPDFDSGGESDIEEDEAFPLPQLEEVDSSPNPSPREAYSVVRPEDEEYTLGSPEVERNRISGRSGVPRMVEGDLEEAVMQMQEIHKVYKYFLDFSIAI